MANYKLYGREYRGHSVNDTIPSATNKTNYRRFDTDTFAEWYSDGTKWIPRALMAFPSKKKTGRWQGNSVASSAGEGILNPLSVFPTSPQTSLFDADGKGGTFDTTVTASTQAGLRSGLAATRRDYNPRLKFKFKLNSTAGIRLFAGWGGSSAPTGDTPLNALNGVLFGITVMDNTTGPGSTVGWQIHHNDGGATAATDNLSISADTVYHEVEIVAINSSSKFTVQLDNGTPVDVTTDIPAATTTIYPMILIQNDASGASGKTFGIYYVELEQDK